MVVSGFMMTDLFPELFWQSSTLPYHINVNQNPLFQGFQGIPLATATTFPAIPSIPAVQPSPVFLVPKLPKQYLPRKRALSMTYKQMIIFAIASGASKNRTLAEILEFLAAHVLECNDKEGTGWRESIRHNLSIHKEFIKMTNKASELGPGKSTVYFTWDHQNAVVNTHSYYSKLLHKSFVELYHVTPVMVLAAGINPFEKFNKELLYHILMEAKKRNGPMPLAVSAS